MFAHGLAGVVAAAAGKVMPKYITRPHMSNHGGPFTRAQLEQYIRANLNVAKWAPLMPRSELRKLRVKTGQKQPRASAPAVQQPPLLPRGSDTVKSWLHRAQPVQAVVTDSDEEDSPDSVLRNPASKIWRRLPFQPNLQEKHVLQVEGGIWNPVSTDHWVDWWTSTHPAAALTRWVAPTDIISQSYVAGVLSQTRIL